MRTAAGLGNYAFADPGLAIGDKVEVVHIQQLRTALDEAREDLLLSTLYYTDPTLTAMSTRIKAAHVTELRNGVK
jgi:hypothetical protein